MSDLDVSILFPSKQTEVEVTNKDEEEVVDDEDCEEEEEDKEEPLTELQRAREEGIILKLEQPVNRHVYLNVWEENTTIPKDTIPKGKLDVYSI